MNLRLLELRGIEKSLGAVRTSSGVGLSLLDGEYLVRYPCPY